MLPDAVAQQLGWGMPGGQPPIDPALAGGPPAAPAGPMLGGLDWLHPAVLQGLGAGAGPAPGPGVAASAVPGGPPGTPEPPMPADLPTIGGPGAALPSSPSPAPSGPAGGKDFSSPAPGAAPAPAGKPAGKPGAPAKPMTVEQSMDANQAQLGQATQEQKGAVAAETQAKIGEAADMLTAEQTNAKQQADLMAQAAKQRDDRMQAEALAHRTTMDRMKALDDYKIDANKYWNDMGLGGKIGTFIGMALSGIGNALSGKGDAPNPVIAMLQQKMKQSIQLQQDQRDQLEKRYGRAKDEEQHVALVQAQKAADNAAAQTDATKMLKIQVDLATAKAADPLQRAQGMKESAGLDRQLALDTGNEIDKRAKYNIEKQKVGIAGGELALNRKKLELDTAWKSWEQNRDQQKLDLQAAKETLAERKAIGEKDVQLGVSAPVSDGQGGMSAGMLTQKDGTVWHAANPEIASKTQNMVAAARTYNELAGKMITGIAQHGGESGWIKSQDFQNMQTDLQAAVAELHDAYGITSFREPTVKFFEQMATAGTDPTSFVYNATSALKNSSTNLQSKVNTKLQTANYNGKPISFAPLDAPEANSPQDKVMTALKDNTSDTPITRTMATIANVAGAPGAAPSMTGLSSKLALVATLGQQVENQGPGAGDAASMLKAIASDATTINPKVREAAQQAIEAAAAKRQAASYQAADKSYPVIHPASPQGRTIEAQSHIPGIIQRINGQAEPPAYPP